MNTRRFMLLILFAANSFLSASAEERVTIHVFSLFHPQVFSVQTVAGQPLALTAGGLTSVLESHASRSVIVRKSQRGMLVRIGDTQESSTEVRLASQSDADAEFVLSVPGKVRRRYRGQLVIRPGNGELNAVVTMDLEVAVASIVASELETETPMEALKAQAVMARSYLLAGGKRHRDAGFCDTTHCQFLRSAPGANTDAARAAASTAGLVLKWQGRAFPAMYSASCGGKTHSLRDIGYEPAGYPYYAVECARCREAPERWRRELQKEDADALGTKMSEAARVRAGRKLGWNAVPSNNYRLQRTETGAELVGVGRGHGVGLCQRGAAAMAASGKDFRAILAHYFPNTTVESK